MKNRCYKHFTPTGFKEQTLKLMPEGTHSMRSLQFDNFYKIKSPRRIGSKRGRKINSNLKI